MRIISRMRRQIAVYWPYAGVDNFGKPKYGTAIELRVRWEDVNEQFVTPGMTTTMSAAKVYVGQDVLVNGVLWLSTKKPKDPPGSALSELTSATKPFDNPRAFKIQRFDKLPTLKATKVLRTAYL